MKKYLFPVVALVAAMASCTSDVEDATVSEKTGKAQKYAISAKPFENADDLTRTIFTLSGNKLAFSWDHNEIFGVYPIAPKENTQVKWELSGDTDDANHNSNYALFTGQGWQLEDCVTYAAYQPYNGNMPSNTPYTAVPVTMPTSFNGTLSDVSAVDYLWATNTYTDRKDTDGDRVIFEFSHAIAIVQIVLPDDAIEGASVSIDFESNIYPTSGTMDITTGTVTSTNATRNVELASTTDVNGKQVCYLPIFPTTVNDIEIHYNDNTAYSTLVVGKTLQAGKAYRWNVQ